MGKILLVDDHPDILKLLAFALRNEGHTLLTASNGVEALEVVSRERPDLVVLDVVMPVLDGLRVLNRIKTNPELCNTTVMMLTIKDDPPDIALGLDVGADYYLGKPFRPDELASMVRRIMNHQIEGARTS